jgi:hypothetical protein
MASQIGVVAKKTASKRPPVLTEATVGKSRDVSFTSTQVVAAVTTTTLMLVPAPGEGKALEFLGATLNVFGGSANYDQNQNFIVAYADDGSGTTVSLTLANFMNGAAVGSIKSLKPIATDVALTANSPLVLRSSASAYNAAGDRNLRVKVYYRVVDVQS